MRLLPSVFLAMCAALLLTSVSAPVFAAETPVPQSTQTPTQPSCDDACCFKESVGADGKKQFSCESNWCQQTCGLVYPPGKDGKPDFNKKPSCGCQAAPAAPAPAVPPTTQQKCSDRPVCEGECLGRFSRQRGQCRFSAVRGGCYCETGVGLPVTIPKPQIRIPGLSENETPRDIQAPVSSRIPS
jgi:hypothetical protein